MATKQKQLFLQLQSIKNNYGSYLKLYKCFFYFERLTNNAIKNETEKNYKSLLGINLVKYTSKFLAHLSQTGTSTSVQNNCIKLSGFCVDITRFFLHWEITRNISCREKFFNPKIRSQVFRANPIFFFHYLLFYFRLNETGNDVFSEWTKLYP